MNNNDIEEDIKKLEQVIKLAKDTGLDKTLALRIENILVDRERLKKENEIYREERNSLEKDGFVGYADELIDILEEE